jgi:hypothetical protein
MVLGKREVGSVWGRGQAVDPWLRAVYDSGL